MRRALLALALVTACGGEKRPPPTGSQLGAALEAALTAAAHVTAPWRCAAVDGPPLVAATIPAGDAVWSLAADSVSLGEATGRPELVIGAIADAGGASPTTLAAIGRLRTGLARADVVLALGGMGTSKEALVATLGALSTDATFLVVALPGDLEDAGALAAAVQDLRARGLAIVDGRLAQRVRLGRVTIAVIPGASTERRLAAAGCLYPRAAVERAATELAATTGMRVLASAEAPRQDTADGEATGELAITVAPGAVDVALHAPSGPATETPSRARTGGHDGAAVALTPGSADATTRLPTAGRRASAGLLTVRGEAWSWKPLVDTAP